MGVKLFDDRFLKKIEGYKNEIEKSRKRHNKPFWNLLKRDMLEKEFGVKIKKELINLNNYIIKPHKVIESDVQEIVNLVKKYSKEYLNFS